MPALAGIHVMLLETKKLLIDLFVACISRYSCNVTADVYLLPLSASLIKSCEACFK